MDRLKELKRGAPPPPTNDNDGDLEKGGYRSVSGKNEEAMQQFFSDIEIVKSNIVVIKEVSKKVGEINQNVNQATTADKELNYSNELEPLIKSTNKKASIAKQLLKRLREETEAMKSDHSGKLTPEIRIRENLANTLTRKFVDVMVEYQNAQTKYKTDIKKKVKRQVQIVKPDATTEEIDTVFKSGGGSGEFLKNTILSGQAADSIQNAYMTVADKYKDVLTLEASVAELHQMFMDFALLVDKQGELLDQIETQVKEAAEYIDDANVELVAAIELQISIRYKQCIIALIILIIIGVVAGVVAAQANGAL